MPSKLINELDLDADCCRDIVNRNDPIDHCLLTIETDETWLPAALAQTGFFASNGQVKKNRPDFWRDLIPGEIIKIGKWAVIEIVVT